MSSLSETRRRLRERYYAHDRNRVPVRPWQVWWADPLDTDPLQIDDDGNAISGRDGKPVGPRGLAYAKFNANRWILTVRKAAVVSGESVHELEHAWICPTSRASTSGGRQSRQGEIETTDNDTAIRVFNWRSVTADVTSDARELLRCTGELHAEVRRAIHSALVQFFGGAWSDDDPAVSGRIVALQEETGEIVGNGVVIASYGRTRLGADNPVTVCLLWDEDEHLRAYSDREAAESAGYVRIANNEIVGLETANAVYADFLLVQSVVKGQLVGLGHIDPAAMDRLRRAIRKHMAVL